MPEAKQVSGDIFEIKLPKRFTFDDANRFNKMLERSADNDCPIIRIDISRTEFIDSAGLGMLLLARDTAEKIGKTIIIKSPQIYVKKLFNVSRFNELFKIED